MYDAYSRMEILLGQKGVNRLSTAKIAVFGLGGAGSYTVEALARCGVGSLTLVDHEAITVTDINRQLYALQSTIGHKKVQIAKERVHKSWISSFLLTVPPKKQPVSLLFRPILIPTSTISITSFNFIVFSSMCLIKSFSERCLNISRNCYHCP